jgi:hypothetical protein
MALVVALISDEYLRYLDDADSGILSFLGRFVITIGTQVFAVIGAIAYRATAPNIATSWDLRPPGVSGDSVC